jgi:hypothetical protein
MHIRLSSHDAAMLQSAAVDIEAMLAKEQIADAFSVSRLSASGAEVTRGDPVTLATIVLSAVSAGGALTIAMSKEGFLTRLAKVLEVLAKREVQVTIETNNEKVHLSGPAGHIERVLKAKLK